MSYSQYQFEAMDERELIDIVEQEQDEFTSSPAERALVTKFKEIFRDGGDLVTSHQFEGALSDISAQIPDEDFLADAIEMASNIANGKMLKKDLLTEAKRLIELLEDIQSQQASASEFALEIIGSFTTKKG